MSDVQHEDIILQLANLPGSTPGKGKKGPRRVATAGGAAYYGQPIGTIITADMIEAKRAENKAKGVKPEKGMLSGGSGNKNAGTPGAANPNAGGSSASAAGGSATPGAGGGGNAAPVGGNIHKQTSYAAPGIDSTPPDWISNPPEAPKVQQATGLVESTIKGPKKFNVGTGSYSAPEGSRLIRPKDENKAIAFVVTPDGQLHAFTANGEVQMDNVTKQALTARFGSKVKPDDSLYGEQEFDQAVPLDKVQVGQKLYDADGNDIFTKGESSWVHSELGLEVSDEDIAPLYESGELTTGKAAVDEEEIDSFDWGDDEDVEISFNEMSKDEFDAYMSTLEPGDEIYAVGPSSKDKDAPQEYSTLVLGEDGKFHREVDGQEFTSSPAALFSLKGQLRTIEPKDLNPAGTYAKQQNDETLAKLKDESDKSNLAAQKAQEAASKEGAQPSAQTSASMAQQKADSAKKAYEDAAGITDDNTAVEAAEKVNAAEAKKAADDAAIASEAQQAVQEVEDLQAGKDALLPSQQHWLKEASLGNAPQKQFLWYALPGSQVYDTNTGTVYTKVAKADTGADLGKPGDYRYWHNETSGNNHNAMVDGAMPPAGSLLVMKNTFKDELKEWTPKNLDEGVGKPVTAGFWDEPNVGAVVQGYMGETFHFNNNFQWVNSKSPWTQVNSVQVKKEAAKGEHKLLDLGNGEPKLLHVGDQIYSGSSNDSFNNQHSKEDVYDWAPAGSQVVVKPFSNVSSGPYVIELNEEGQWVKPNGAKSYELPDDGDLYISKLGGDAPKKALEVGDTPDEKWFSTSPVGSTIKHNESGNLYSKKENGLWNSALSDSEGVYSSADFWDDEGEEYPYTVVDPETAKSEPPQSTAVKKVAGDVVTYDDLLLAPVGTKFKYNKLNGEQSDYSKLNENEILMPGGVIQPIHHWKNSVDKGKVEYADDTFLGEAPAGEPTEHDTLDVVEPTVDPTGDDSQDAASYQEYTEELADWEKELLGAYEEPSTAHLDENGEQKDEKFSTVQLDNFNLGTKIGWGPQADYWTKVEGEWWLGADGKKRDSFEISTQYGNLWLSHDAGSKGPKRFAPGEEIPMDDVNNLPEGLVVKLQSNNKPSEHLVFVVDNDGFFVEPDNEKSAWTESDLWEYFDGGATLYAGTPEDVITADNLKNGVDSSAINFEGEKVSADELNEYPVGTTVLVQFNGDGVEEIFELGEDGWWHGPETTEFTSDILHDTASHIKLAQLGEGAQTDPYQYYLEGNPLPSGNWELTEFLGYLPIGSKIFFYENDGDEEYTQYYAKEIDSAWWDPDDGGQEQGYESDQFHYMASGSIYLEQVGDGTSPHDETTKYIQDMQQQAADEAAAGDDVPKTWDEVVQDITAPVHFDWGTAGGIDVTPADMLAAIDALQNHPHGSPAYGLKTLPDDNDVKAWGKAFIDEAKGAYPKHKPKQALIEFLKDNVGTFEKDDKSVDEADNPTIHLGKDKPTKNAFGVTGGDFKQSEIDQAIELLESYDGKQFKSFLTNNGNPLGALDFNTLLGGVDKDKLAQKAKAIAYLKEQVKDLAPVQKTTASDFVPGSSTDPDAGGSWTLTPWDELNKPYSHGDKIQLQDLTTFQYDSHAPGELKWFKPMDEESGWFSVHDVINQAIDEESKTWVSSAVDPSEGLVAIPKGDFLVSFPEGTKILWKTTTGTYVPLTKKGATWHTNDDSVVGAVTLFEAAEQGRLHILDSGNNTNSGFSLDTPITSMQQFYDLKVGSKIFHQSSPSLFYTKTGGNEWEYTDENGEVTENLDNDAFAGALNAGHLKLHSQPNDVPENYKAPAAVQSKPKVYSKKNSDPKLEDHTLTVWPDGSGTYKNGYGATHDETPEDVQKELNDPAWKLVSDGGEAGQKWLPGLYHGTNPQVKLSIHADGTATYDNGDGQTKLAHIDKANLDQWPIDTDWTYLGPLAGTLNPIQPPVPKVKANPKKNYDFKPSDIPDGSYFLGNPNDSKTPLWHVKGGVVEQLDSDGTLSNPSPTKVKNAVLKGLVVDKWGNTAVLPEGYVGSVKFLNHDTNTESLKAIRNVLDNSPVLDKLTLSTSDQKLLASYGLFVGMGELSNYVELTKGDTSPQSITSAIYDYIDATVGQKVAGTYDDNDAVGDFEWAADQTQAISPAYAVKHFPAKHVYFTNSEAIAAIKDISSNFGDGKTIGQHYQGMSAQDKRTWLFAFRAGNFSLMYELEVKGAIKQGVSHVAGWKHPGYPDNASTNKITWAPAVQGEKPAGSVAGNWTDLANVNQSSPQELDNYLIAASFQHPTYLTPAEKLAFVRAHRSGSQWVADNYSLKAKALAEAGEKSLTSPPVWTDAAAPPKLYNVLFVNTKYPSTGWSADAAKQFFGDFAAGDVDVLDTDGKKLSYTDIHPILNAVEKEFPYAQTTEHVRVAVGRFFEGLAQKQNALDSTPVYKKSATQNIKQTNHPVYNYEDQFGNKYIFKVAPNDGQHSKAYRAAVEAKANAISQFFGGKAPNAQVIELDGKLGVLQEEVAHVSTLSGFNWANADKTQTIDLANEHVIDWMLDQDDNWAPNTFLTPDGHLVGIDKGRSFASYGHWKGLAADSSIDVNTHLVYSDLYQAIIKGQVSKETADATWLAVQKRVKAISNSNNEQLLGLLHEATDLRKDWNVPYKIDGKTVPQTQQGFFDAFFDRKAKLPEQIEALWKDIYAKAGYGDLPVPAPTVLGEGQHSGLDDANLHATVLKVGAHGTSTLVGGNGIIGGTAVLGKSKNSDGTVEVNGQMYLGPKTEDEVLAWFKANTDPSSVSAEKAIPGAFTHDDKSAPFIAAAKTIGAHAEDGNYNASTLSTYESAKKDIQKDLDFWTPDLAPEGANDFVQFPSGKKVEFGQVDQYKMMLDHYASKTSILDSALASKTKPAETIEPFSPVKLNEAGFIYLDGSGQKLVKLSNGSWIFNNGSTVSVLPEGEGDSLLAGDSNWTKWKDQPDSAKIVYKSVLGPTHNKAGSLIDFELSNSDSLLSAGNKGNEYEVTLPTGEKIYFRNGNTTNTIRSQRGRLSFRLPNPQTESDVSKGLSNVQSWIETNLGLDLSAATHENAELIYWREMYGVLQNRKHKAGSPWAAAKVELDKKIAQVGGGEGTFLETFGAQTSVDEQNKFFRDLWGNHFGAEKVSKLVADESYLPHYENLDLRYPDAVTGHPQWTRFDVDLSDFAKANKMLVSRNTSTKGPLEMVKSGGALSTEERMRVLGQNITGMSSSSDQSYGSANFVFTRIMPTDKHSGFSYIYHPRSMLRTRTYSFNGDHFGRLDDRKANSPSNPLDSWVNFTSGGNETLLPFAAGLFGDLEIVVFDDAALLNEAIQYLKKLGIDQIRGVPIEDRLVLRKNLQAAIDKLKKTWYGY